MIQDYPKWYNQELLSELKISNSPRSGDSRERVLEGNPGNPKDSWKYSIQSLSQRSHNLPLHSHSFSQKVASTVVHPWQLNWETSGVTVSNVFVICWSSTAWQEGKKVVTRASSVICVWKMHFGVKKEWEAEVNGGVWDWGRVWQKQNLNG